MLAAAVMVLIALLARVLGWAPFDAYPVLNMPVGVGTAAASVGLALAALLPFLDRRGIAR
jgi:hypothetical protein